MNLACTVDQRDGITLVELDVTNPTRTARRIRIENTLAGEILPPRHHGTPVKGWDEEGVTVMVDAGEHRALGYACQARPRDPPARIVGSEPTDSMETASRTAGTVMAALGDPRPPRDVVEPDHRRVSSATEQNRGTVETVTDHGGGSGRRDRPAGTERTDSTEGESEATVPSKEESVGGTGRPVHSDRDDTDCAEPAPIPPAIDAWLQLKAEQVAGDEPVDVRLLSTVSRRARDIATRATQ